MLEWATELRTKRMDSMETVQKLHAVRIFLTSSCIQRVQRADCSAVGLSRCRLLFHIGPARCTKHTYCPYHPRIFFVFFFWSPWWLTWYSRNLLTARSYVQISERSRFFSRTALNNGERLCRGCTKFDVTLTRRPPADDLKMTCLTFRL